MINIHSQKALLEKNVFQDIQTKKEEIEMISSEEVKSVQNISPYKKNENVTNIFFLMPKLLFRNIITEKLHINENMKKVN